MAHNIGKMFYVGERPWHSLGTPLKTPINAERALKEGGLDYTVSLMPLAVKGEPTSAVPQRMSEQRSAARQAAHQTSASERSPPVEPGAGGSAP